MKNDLFILIKWLTKKDYTKDQSMLDFYSIEGSSQKIKENEQYRQARFDIYGPNEDNMKYCRPYVPGIIHLVILVRDSKTEKYIAYCVSGIYNDKNTSRPDQWGFEHNRYRSLYLEYIYVKEKYRNKGLGSKLLEMTESFLKTNQSLMPATSRKNMYLVSTFENVQFYIDNGYHVITTPDHDSDCDYPYVYSGEVAQFMCKPLLESLDKEKDDLIDQGYLLDKYCSNRLRGAELLPSSVFDNHVKDALKDHRHPLEFLPWFATNKYYGVDELEIMRLKLNQAIKESVDVEGDELTEKEEEKLDFEFLNKAQLYHRKGTKKGNNSAQEIEKYISKHFPQFICETQL